MARVKKNDIVEVISGYYVNAAGQQAKTGRVLRVMPDEGRVLVEGVNLRYRHTKPNRKNPQGGRVQREMPIPICKVMPIDPKTGRGARVKYTIERTAEGQVKKERVAIPRVARTEHGAAKRTSDGQLEKGTPTVLS